MTHRYSELILKRINEFEKIIQQSSDSSSSNSSDESVSDVSSLEIEYALRMVEAFDGDWERAIFVLQHEREKKQRLGGSSSI